MDFPVMMAVVDALAMLGPVGGVIVGVLGFIVAFGLAVFVHELGHFLAAKAFGVPVERFVIGFDRDAMPFLPPCIWERRIGETVYGLSLVPLGGYVKMSGTVHPDIEAYLDGDGPKKDAAATAVVRPDGVAPRAAAGAAAKGGTLQEQALQDMSALYRKPFWQKFIIYSAGVVMNLLLATLVVAGMLAVGVVQDAPFRAEVSWLEEGNPYIAMGVATGDRVIAMEGKPVASSADIYEILAPLFPEKDSTATVTMDLARPDGTVYTITTTLAPNSAEFLAFESTFVRRPAYVDNVLINGPADKAGVRRGDLFVEVEGTPIADWQHFRHIVRGAADKDLACVVERAGERRNITLRPKSNPDEPGVGQVGVMVGNPEKVTERETVPAAIAMAPGRVVDFTIRYVNQLKTLGNRLVSGNIESVRQNLGGPVGIAQMAYRQAQKGMQDWLQFLILLNVALAVMNILPFPVLDGGHICFALWEAIFGRPVPPRLLVPILNTAVIMILVFFVLVTFNDLWKLFT
jgi:regulator of sigma E protease